jgi:hypothetical protein
MKTIDMLLKAAESATTQVRSYKGHDQGPDMNARAVMEHGKPETPRPHKTTQGPVEETGTDRFSKGAENRVAAPEAEQPVPKSPSQAALESKLQSPAPIKSNRMSFTRPYRSGMVKLF